MSDHHPPVAITTKAKIVSAKEATLAWVNDVRARRGIGEPLAELPSGGRSGWNCPIAKALAISNDDEGYAGTLTVRFGSGAESEVIYYPQEVRLFVRLHDGGKYPELLS